MSVNLNGNQVILIIAVVCCTATAILIPDPSIRGICIGAIAGLIGGHINATQGPGS